MGSIVLYILEWAFALIVLLTIYKAVFSGTTFYRFSRFYLLGATVLSALLPLVHISIPDGNPLASNLSIEDSVFARELSGTLPFSSEPITVTADAITQPQSNSKTTLWAVMLISTYSVYVLMLMIGWGRQTVRTRRFLQGKKRRHLNHTVWLVTHDEDFGPFSWMNYIVISDTENGFARRASLRHEYSHIRLLHSADLVFLMACTIVNPACWFVLQEIKIVHEYEADSEVIKRYGIRNGDYQKLLIMRTVGAEAYALASSFNLNIKKRIIMLNKNQTRKSRLIWLLLLVPMLGMTSVLFARTEIKADMIELGNYYPNDANISAKIAQDGYIIGKVIDDDGPVVNARISVMNLTGTVFYSSFTDEDGNFILREYNPEYMIRIIKAGYQEFKGYIRSEEPVITLTKLKDVEWEVENDVEDDVFLTAEEAPEFPGGMAGLLQYLTKNIKYPILCRENKIQGRVVISFTIDTDGTITDAEVARSVDPLLDAEALRAISQMPAWTPGKIEGKNVKVRYSVPINFRLNDGSAPQTQQWIYLYDAKTEVETDDNVSSLLVSVAYSNEDLGALNTPEMRTFINAFRSAQKEAQSLTEKYEEELQVMRDDLTKKTQEYEKLRESLSESMRSDYEQSLTKTHQEITQKLQERQDKVREWSDKTINGLQSQIKDAWRSISKNGAYVCTKLTTGNPLEGITVSPDDMESAVKDLFEGRRPAVVLPFSDDNYQQIRSLLSDKYASKPVLYMNMR